MAENSRFFGDTTEYTQIQFAEALKTFADGYIIGDLNELVVAEDSPQAMSVTVDTGRAWANGYWFENTAALDVAITAAHATLDRIDTIVIQVDILNTQDIHLVVIDGTPGSSVAPTLTQDANTWEIALADIAVDALVTTIVNADITDRRVAGGIGEGSPFCSLKLSGGQTSGTEILWTDEISDEIGMHAPNAAEIIIPQAGDYFVTARVQLYRTSGSFPGAIGLLKNGSGTDMPGDSNRDVSTGTDYTYKVSGILTLAENDELTIEASAAFTANTVAIPSLTDGNAVSTTLFSVKKL